MRGECRHAIMQGDELKGQPALLVRETSSKIN